MVQEMKRVMLEWYGKDAASSSSFGRMINERHFDRVRALIKTSGGEVIAPQGEMDKASKFIPPTLVRGPSLDAPIMKEEIFGPVLPILKMDSIDSMVRHIIAGEKPLAMYIFGREADADEVMRQTSSGGVCVNDTVFHITNPDLPFGGIGASGTGRYHGKHGFEEFSHARAVMYRKIAVDPSVKYPPYTDENVKLFETLMVGPLKSWLRASLSLVRRELSGP